MEASLPSLRIVGGHGQIASGARVQLGARCRVEVDHEIDAVSGELMAQWLQQNKRFFTDDQVQQLAGDFAAGYFARGVLGALGLIMGKSDYQRYQNAQDTVLKSKSQEQANFINALQLLTNKKMRLTSEMDVYGTSMIPRNVAVFVRVVQIRFGDGRSVNFLDLSDPIAADDAGETSGLQASGGRRLRMAPRD